MRPTVISTKKDKYGYTDGVLPSRVKSEVDEFCYALGGKQPIHSILIANNGMAAIKFISSIRTWAYETFGTEKAVLLVAMAKPEDLRINAEHIKMADQFVQVPGGANNNNYANVQLIVETAERSHVDAVWPGWGHASVKPQLPDALREKGIIFLGPTARSVEALGDKIGSLLIAQAAKVPTLPWTGSHVRVPPESCLVNEIYSKACVFTTEEAIASCQNVGYPAMIKASWGRDGKGVRKVHNNDEVRALFKQVQGELPGSPIFIMKVAPQSRHLEIQLLCDQYGNIASLHSRDCSVQRRHQKIIEEGPITVAPLEKVKELEQAARRLAKCVNYIGAATVEYLYYMDTGDYYFLELNPRLQVEHPVTEWIADINLPAAQVAVGMGIPLWQIPEIRRLYGMAHGGGYDGWRKTSIVATPFDFDKAETTRPRGHCVAVRVTSEDPDDGFKPTSGEVQELSFRSKPNVWAYFAVKSGGGIHEFSDSQFGHVFAFGESRALAIANMVLGLKEIQIRGEIRTNVDCMIDLLHASDYRANKIHTGWLDSRIAMRVKAERSPWYLSVIGGALYKASSSSSTIVSEYIDYLEKGQIPSKHISLVNSEVSLNIEGSKYRINLMKGGPGSYMLRMNQSEIGADIHTLRDGGLLMQLDGNSHVIYADEEAAGTRLIIDGRTCLLQNDHDPSKLVAKTPCKLLRYLISDGSHVDADTPYAEVEVMKMCMPLLAPASGVIQFKMSEGQTMQAGELIASLDLDDPSAVRKAEPFHGKFPLLGPPSAISGKVHQRCAASLNAARMVLAGYEHNVDEVIQNLLSCLDSPELPFLQWQECLAVLATRLPKDLRYELETKCKEYACLQNVDFPARVLRGVVDEHLRSCPDKEKDAQERLIEPLLSLVKSYEGGRESHACGIVHSLFEEYLFVEELFSDNIQADITEHLRPQYKKDPLKVVDLVLSHQGLQRKNKFILCLMEKLVYPNPAAYRDKLIRFSSLNHTKYSELALKASQLLEQTKLSELRSSIARSLSELEMFTKEGGNIETPKQKGAINKRMEALVSAPLAVEDALVGLFDHCDHTLQRRVVETYVRRLYQPYLIKGSERTRWHRSGLIATWEFLAEPSGPLFEKHSERKCGVMLIIKSLQLLPAVLTAASTETVHNLHTHMSNGSIQPAYHGNMLHIALLGIDNEMSLLQDSGNENEVQARIKKLAEILREQDVRIGLSNAGFSVISCIIQRDEGRLPMRHSFHWSTEKLYYEKEPLLCHLEPPLSIYLDLHKIKGYDNVKYIPSGNSQWHLYYVVEKQTHPIQRMFLRTLVRQPTSDEDLIACQVLDQGTIPSPLVLSFTSTSILRSLVSALEELELNLHDTTLKYDHAHMYLYILREQQTADLLPYYKRADLNSENEEDCVEKILVELAHEINAIVGVRMLRLGVCEWEVKLRISSAGEANGAWRVIIANVTGHTCIVHIYREVEDKAEQRVVYQSVSVHGPLHGVAVTAPYPPLSLLDQKRILARKSNTTYCYDFLLAFEVALEKSWATVKDKPMGKTLLKVTELAFADQIGTPLFSVERQPGLNDVGLVAWVMEMSTPGFPKGRKILVVANDVTLRNGTFGPREIEFFQAVTDVACTQKLPFIYLAANSGARIGAAEEVKSCFRVGWSDESIPERGFQYVYLTPEDHERIKSSVIAHELKLSNGEIRWVIDTIIGKEDGLGVENLSGSGSIASAYSRAYHETFTLTYVAGKIVGIGAYLARLGLRCIQRLDQPIILTGYSALNKLLRREVYTSHMQLGGPKTMAANGVAHLTVSDDLEGVSAVLTWLSFVPPYSGGQLPISTPLDPPERPIGYFPETTCDPRAAISGFIDAASGKWLGGIFDKDSFVETLEGWARTVVTGRARLGGIPVGIVAVETETLKQVIPADPGQLDSHERIVPQAGQVWFPDSATKTAQALMDFNREELPLFILANWRGFSGGQRDLFEGILQAGSSIVENLRNYKQPVFVYIPMMGELRGGAWVVMDSKINSDHIEMYAERTAKGNVLEPEGMIEFKFRKKELLECMGRLDRQLINLKSNLQEERAAATIESIQQQIKAREDQLLSVYTQIAKKFAELHDTPLRMAAKGVVREVLHWENSRSFFYRRLRRRIEEDMLIKTVRDAGGDQLSYKSAKDMLKRWFMDSKGGREDAWADDKAFFSWKNDPKNYDERLQQLRVQKVLIQLSKIGDSTLDLRALPQSVLALLQKVEPATREKLINDLRKVLN
ncbi:acetyl-CoA carboxylase 1-like [Lycium ferocissimum]|uniref:acetyl-CoA carboxylase 1-like n=1 Tax=Lycium ferocissimum TaxID=112874 RepID=UPI0028153B62|nr:acetyl-CoA carboxylase 1-like [Lycium ferocissimum]XP_059279750.1 acetyl-CoA carboxylase 1-like [Lycium ferocissimum]